MNKIDIREMFIQAAKVLRAEFDSSSLIPHAQSRGMYREETLKTFLNQHLPKRFAASSGFIVDNLGQASHQIDIIIYDSISTPIYHYSQNSMIINRDSVPIVIEVKSNLTKQGLLKSINDAKAIKCLVPSTKTNEKVKLTNGERELTDEQNQTLETMYVLFAYESTLSLETIKKIWLENYLDSNFGSQIDFIAILDKGIIHVGAWHPNIGMPDKAILSVLCLPQLRMSDKPKSLIIYPIFNKNKTLESVILGSLTVFPVGTKFLMASDNLGEFTFDIFFRTIIGYLSLFNKHESIPILPSYTSIQKDKMIFPNVSPLGICIEINPDTLQVDKEETIINGIKELINKM